MDVRGKKVFVGLSGGVDSAVTAALLKEQGADVYGVFIQGWYPPGMPCTWAEDRRDAMRVAAHLHIPFTTLNASDEYKAGVIDYLLREYKTGRTPNPDVMCNREVKFGAFYRYAKEQGADYIATGHYARSVEGRLLRGVDQSKDQSYFLWAVPAIAIRDTLFPLGDREKGETRKLAARYKLPNAQKRDSQGICFLGNISVEDFLKQEFGVSPGAVETENGLEIGTHDGVLLHTLGERITPAGAAPGPWYVVAKDIEKNVLTVSKERVQASDTHALTLSDTHWFDEAPSGTVEAQFRYHGPLIKGTFSQNTFTPDAPLPEAVASGQSLVLYAGDRVLGGGIIA